MIQKCEHCQQTYEVGISQTYCPHRPISKECEKHKRTNCGNCEQKEQGVDNANIDRNTNPTNVVSYHQSSIRG